MLLYFQNGGGHCDAAMYKPYKSLCAEIGSRLVVTTAEILHEKKREEKKNSTFVSNIDRITDGGICCFVLVSLIFYILFTVIQTKRAFLLCYQEP